jgi:hypothetical protein
MFLTYYIICVIYCLYQLFKNHSKRYSNDPIGGSPELDTIMVVVMAWVLAPVDVSLTWIRWYKSAEEARIRNSKFDIDFKIDRNEEAHIY